MLPLPVEVPDGVEVFVEFWN